MSRSTARLTVTLMLRPVGSRARPRLQAVRERLAAPVDGASLAVFRIAFGLVLVWEAYRYFPHDWIPRYWIEPAFNFGYPGFGWLEPLPGAGMYVVWALIGVAGLGIALGTWYRASATVAFVLFGYQFLLEQARYLNHFYLMILLLGILVVVLPTSCCLPLRATPGRTASDGDGLDAGERGYSPNASAGGGVCRMLLPGGMPSIASSPACRFGRCC